MRDRAILRLLGDVGLRPREVCALQLGDILWGVDGRAPVQLQVAWGQGRVVVLTDQATAALVDWLASHPGWQPAPSRRNLPAVPLFVALGQARNAMQAITEDGLLRQVLRHAQQAGIPAHLRYPYVLRHFSGRANRSLAGPRQLSLQARGGWRDRRSAQVYFQQPPAAAALAAALDLDRGTPPTR